MNSFVGKRGDSYDRFLIRMREMYESINIVFQVLSNLITFSNNPKSNNSKLDFFSFFEFLYKHRKDSLNKKTKYTSMENLISHFKKI
jgi:NADH:ubiquinone oxidoreductase subunit D